jgi:YegS/Rv2252/BmrU family lipid kinase
VSKRSLLLINPHARRGAENRLQVTQRLQELGLDLVEESAEDPGKLPELIRQYGDRVDRVIIGGGDGTVNAAIAGLLATHLPVGVIPLGTANNLARTLGIPQSPLAACDVIAQNWTRSIDLGWVNGNYFLNVAGLGLSAKINHSVPKQFKRRWGVIAYVVTAFRLILKQRRFRAEIRCDGEVIQVKTLQITVCNGRFYGSGLTVAADADIDDHRLDLCSLEIEHWWQAFGLIPAVFRGEYATEQGMRLLQGQEIEVFTRKVRPIDTDGEITTQTPATFRVIPGAIAVYVPKLRS